MTGTLSTVRDTLGRIARSYATVVVVALLVAAAVAPIAWGTTNDPDGTVAVIEMDQTITEPVAEEVRQDLREARENDSIDAVVLRVDSPGGGVTASESLSLAVERTAEEMPVVTSVQSMGVSGGYYMIAPSDEIYVTPGSMIGHVGVRATHLDQPTIEEEITTGPDKAGMTEAEVTRQIEQMKQAFVSTVMEHRGDELTLTETELAYAKMYTGVDGVEKGLADDIGDTDVAIGAAAERAGLSDYEIVEMEREPPTQQMLVLGNGEGSTNDARTHQQTFGNYGAVNTPAFLAVWGSIEGETVVATSAPAAADAAPATGGEAP